MNKHVWNQAAWRQNTYRARKVVAPVGESKPLPDPGMLWCSKCRYHSCSCDRQHTVPMPANPRGWETAEASTDDILTVSDVAKLPVGTRVVVVKSAWIPSAVELSLVRASANSFGLVSTYGSRYHVHVDDVDTFRLAEPAKPALLTLAEAKAAVDAGRTVRCVEGYDEGSRFCRCSEGYVKRPAGFGGWLPAPDFPTYVGLCGREDMRFEVVEK